MAGALGRMQWKPPQLQAFNLWPEHVAALHVWQQAATGQLRWADGRPSGVEWHSLRAHPVCIAMPDDQRERVLRDVAAMERPWISATLRAIAERRERG